MYAFIKITLVILSTLISFTSFAQNRYLDPSGSDSGDCSDPGSPCQSVNYAISQAAASDILNLSSGTFTSATVDKRLSIQGEGDGTIIQGITINATVSGADLVTISDLRVISAGANGIEIATSYVTLSDVNSSDHSNRNVNINAAADISNISINDCTFDNGGGGGLWIDETTGLDGLTILNTTFDGSEIGLYSQLGISTTLNRVQNVVIRNCSFNNCIRKGIYAEKLESAIFENISVVGSGTDASYGFNNGIDINLKWQSYSDITIRNSRITGCGAIGSNDIGTAPENRRTSAITIKARTDASSYSGTPASLSNVTLDGIIIDGLVTDLRFGEMGKADNDGIDMSTVTITHCYLTNDNLSGLLNEENTNTLTISNNYWGGGAPSGTDIENYGTSAATSQSSELSQLIVDDANNTSSTLASAITSASPNAIIQNIPAGAINGTTTINKNITLVSPGAGLLDATNSLVTFENLSVTSGILTLGSDFAASTTVTLANDVVMGDYNFDGAAVSVNSGGSIQDGVDMTINGGTVTIASGTFSETITISDGLTLHGANQGIASSGSRSAETIIEPPSSGTAITIGASSVTIDGIQIGTSAAASNASTGIISNGNNIIAISNNIIYANSVGMNLGFSESGISAVSNNLIQMLDLKDATNVPSVGLYVHSISGSSDLDILNNDLSTTSYGILGYNLTSSNTLLIDGGNFSNCTKGIEIDNTDGTNFNPSTVSIQNVTMSSFTGPASGLISGQPDTQAGIYAFVTGNADAIDDLVIDMNNVDVSGIGNGGADYSGIYIADFQASGPFDGTDDDGIGITSTLSNSNLHDNSNRAVYVRGRNASLNITQTTFTDNGADPFGTGGNYGFNIVSRAFASATASNCFFTSPATQTSSQFDGLSRENTASMTVTNSFFNNNGNPGNTLAGATGIDLSGNHFSTTDEATILGLVGNNDFTPWIASGTDTDGGTTGFQPDFSTTHIGTSGSQTSGSRWQEGHDLTDASGTVIVGFGDYNESITSTKNITFQPTSSGPSDASLDNLGINGTSTMLTLSGNLLINNAVTLTDGIIDVSSGQLRLGSSASDLAESSTSYITGNVVLDARNIGTGSIDFLGASIAAGADDIGNVTISRNSGAVGIITAGNSNTSISSSWDITVDTQPAAGRDVSFTWLPAQDNGKDMTQISVFRNPGSGWSQVAGPFDVSALNPRVVNVTGVTEFSEWSMAQNDAPLPVTLVKFEAREVGQSILLNWHTASEINSSHFEIQRSNNGNDFFALAEIPSHQNSQVLRKYKWNDQTSFVSPIVYYRLKMIDLDGTYEFSKIISVEPNFSNSLQIYPNPAQDFIQVKAWSNQSIDHFSIIDIHGRTVSSMKKEDDIIDVSQWISGIYFIKVNVNGVNTTHRIIIE